jgi:hypothetical protein
VQDRFRLLCGTEGNSEPNNVRFIIADLQGYTLPDCAPAGIMMLVVFIRYEHAASETPVRVSDEVNHYGAEG